MFVSEQSFQKTNGNVAVAPMIVVLSCTTSSERHALDVRSCISDSVDGPRHVRCRSVRGRMIGAIFMVGHYARHIFVRRNLCILLSLAPLLLVMSVPAPSLFPESVGPCRDVCFPIRLHSGPNQARVASGIVGKAGHDAPQQSEYVEAARDRARTRRSGFDG